MALIQCPDCGKSISEDAESCPDCGAPINRAVGEETAGYSSFIDVILIIAGLSIFFGGSFSGIYLILIGGVLLFLRFWRKLGK